MIATLFIALRAMLLPVAGTAQQPAAITSADPSAVTWGDVTDGLQLRVSTGVNTETLTETESLLYLSVQMRNVSETPVSADFDQATYAFEYEIDGTWYAFERMPPIPTPLTQLYARLGPDARSTIQTVAPGSATWTMLTVPLDGRSRTLQLHAVTANGPGRRFEPKPGAHVVRVRPGPAALQGRQAPVSNAVTVSLRTPGDADRRDQSVSFGSSRGTAFQDLRFASGPADGQAFIREVLARPPNPASAPRLITSAALEVLEPLPFYELVLPRRANAPHPPLPTTTDAYHYLARASDQTVGTIGLASSAQGSVLNWIGSATSAEPVFSALQRLTGMEQVRDGDYEPRLMRVTGVRGTSQLLVLWLHSSSGRPDLFYRPRDPDFRGSTRVEPEKVYITEELLAAARTLPVTPRYDEAWAITTAIACAKTAEEATGRPLIYEQASAEIGLSEQEDRIVWYVYFPERVVQFIASHMGAAFYVDEANGACARALLGG